MSDQSNGAEQPAPPKWSEAALKAKARLDSSINDLQKAAQGTQVANMLAFQLLIFQVDVMIDMLAELNLFPRETFFERVTVAVDKMASECRRAILSQGGASVLAGKSPGFKKPS